MQLELATRVVRPGGIIIVCASAADHTPILPGRPVDETLAELVECTVQWTKPSGDANRAHWAKRDLVCKEELMRLPLEQLSRILSRRLGEPRSTTMSWSHRRCLEQNRVFLVTEGVSSEEADAMGFAYYARTFEDTLAKALGELGQDARVVVNGPVLGIPQPAG